VDTFTVIVLIGVGAIAVALLAIGFWHPASASQVFNKDREKGWADQATIEEREVPEMIEGQNVYRRRRGQVDLTEAEIRRLAAGRQRESIEQAERHGGE
jgi:FtsZ-interacting cell division protein ZipA